MSNGGGERKRSKVQREAKNAVGREKRGWHAARGGRRRTAGGAEGAQAVRECAQATARVAKARRISARAAAGADRSESERETHRSSEGREEKEKRFRAE